jgi:parallel beta-helix repeat protein
MRLRILAGAALLALTPLVAPAATYRYDGGTNTIYVEGGGTATLTETKAALSDAPLELFVGTGRVWLLSAHLRVRDGTILVLHGALAAGDVDELRLKSDDAGFVSLVTEYGTLDIASTRIHSWNPAAAAVDTEYATGRAFVRARSFLDSAGVARESRMDIVDSEISYLGYNGVESQGLVWKVGGSAPGTLDRVNVYGNLRNSHVHHNYYGVYSFGHEGGQWLGNEVDHNVKYGFDPHDDSDNMRIENNDVHDNGNHGIIASKRCDHIVIRGNRSYGNTGVGIVLHRASNDGLIEDNDSYLNTDAGIALFANRRSIVRNNRIHDNAKYGVRLSMGEADSVIESNDLGFGLRYVIYLYRGHDTPEPGDDGRPKRNVLRNNVVHDIAGDPVKVSDADDTAFVGNTFERTGPTLHFTRATRSAFRNNAVPAGTRLALKATSAVPSSIEVGEQPAILLQLQDEYSTGTFTDPGGAIFDPDESLFTTAGTAGSTLALTQALIATNTTVYTRRLTVRPDSGSVQVQPIVWNVSGDRTKTWKLASPGAIALAFTVGDLLPGVSYDVFRGTTLLGTFTANAVGAIAFSHRPPATAGSTYSVKPH